MAFDITGQPAALEFLRTTLLPLTTSGSVRKGQPEPPPASSTSNARQTHQTGHALASVLRSLLTRRTPALQASGMPEEGLEPPTRGS